VKLTAPDECSPQMKQLRTKQIPKTTAGYNVAVCAPQNKRETKNTGTKKDVGFALEKKKNRWLLHDKE